MSMNPSEQRLYHSQSPRTRTRSGTVRSAIDTGVATLTPSFFAGMDAAVTMLRRSFGSPDTTEGMSRRSWPPSMTSFTADQERKAEFTSIWKMTRDKVNKAFLPDAYARSRGCAGNARGYWPRCTCRACTSRAGRPRNCRWCRRPPGGRGLPRRNPRA